MVLGLKTYPRANVRLSNQIRNHLIQGEGCNYNQICYVRACPKYEFLFVTEYQYISDLSIDLGALDGCIFHVGPAGRAVSC